MAAPMECHCIPSVEIPHTTALYATYLRTFPALAGYFVHPPTLESVRQVASTVKPDAAMRRSVADVLRGQNRQFSADSSVQAAIDRFAVGAAVIVSGQQAGLFSGPAYTIYKALHALKVAGELTAAGTAAVAVFWLATEDHDLAEVNHCLWPIKGGVERLEMPPAPAPGRSVGEILLAAPVEALVERAAAALDGPEAAAIAQMLRESYGATETYGSAFGKLLARVFAGRGLILIDPLAPDLHRLAAPVYAAALRRHAELGQELIARGHDLEKAGYHAQVKVTERSTLLFVAAAGDGQNGARLPLVSHGGPQGDGFALGEQTLTAQEVETLLANSPERFSANVLLRPIVQDTLLGSAAAVVGPAEVAYMAQAAVVYQLLGRMPVILPRASFTLVQPHLVNLLKKYNLEFTDLLAGEQSLRRKMEHDLVPQALAEQFTAGEKTLREMLEQLREPIARLDPTLSGSLENTESKMLYQFTRLQEKVARAMSFRSSVLETHQRQLLDVLVPHGGLQERSLCLLPLLAVYGTSLLDELSERMQTFSTQHQVLYL